MSEHSPERVKEIFGQALDLSPDERISFLESACGADETLRRRVEKLLKSLDDVGPFLASPTENVDPDARTRSVAAATSVAVAGMSIGPYKLLQEIGEGGFGVVYMAEQQEPIRRRVALKVIKVGMDTKQVIGRFEAERQALAMMEHPNIAQVLDAGATESGRPYFVMELVRGVDITEYCDKENLTTRERLDLFMDVCSAVQHAHQKGVIHRDIKPSNVMITLHDGKPVPKVIDFGIAKATHQRLTEKTMFTEYGHFIGSPAYMSPEQAEMSGLDVDTRSDIYSLGVLLYELLTGTTPVDPAALRDAGYNEIQRMIREDEPPTPSTRLGTLGDALTDIAKHRRVDPAALTTIVRGDLDWIAMKALEKNRTRRYESASELAADIERHLDSEPVLARPHSAVYRLRKLAKKHRGPVAAVAAILITVLLFGSVALWQGLQAQRQAKRVHAQSVLVSAAATGDPLLKALLLDEIPDARNLPGALAVAHDAAGSPLPIRILRGHEGQIRSAAFSSDGTRFITGAPDGVRIWDSDGNEVLHTNLGHDDWVLTAEFSPDGTRFLTSSHDCTARVSQADGSGEPIVLQGHERWLLSAAFSPDGDSVVTASLDGTAKVWSADGAGTPNTLKGHVGEVFDAGFSPDGKRVVTASADGSARVWQLDGRSEPVVLQHDDEQELHGAAFSPDGSTVATASSDGAVRLWNSRDGRPIARLRGHQGAVYDVGFSPDGRQLVTASEDGTARLWKLELRGDVPEPIEWRFDRGHTDWRPTPPVIPELKPVNTRIVDDALRLSVDVDNLNPGTERLLGSIYVELPDLNFLDWSHVEIQARTADPVRLIGLDFNYSETNPTNVLPFQSVGNRVPVVTDGTVQTYRLSLDWPDTRRWVGPWTRLGIWFNTPSSGGTAALDVLSVRLIPQEEPKFESTVLRGHVGPVYSAAFSPEGGRVITASDDGTARVWRAAWGQSRVVFRGHQAWINRVAYSHDGARVVTASDDGTARVWRADGTGTSVVLRHEHAVIDASFNKDDTRVLTASNDTVYVWPADGAGPPVRLTGHEDIVLRAVFSPDGKQVATASEDGTARIWSVDGASTPVVLRGHEREVVDIAFSPDGKRVATTSNDGTTRVWPAEGGEAPLIFQGDDEPFLTVAFNARGDLVTAASEWDTSFVWSADGTGEHDLRLPGHQDWARSAAFSPDGTRVVTASDDGWVRIWRTNGQGEPLILSGHKDYVLGAIFSPDGTQVVSFSRDGTARIWRADGTGDPAVLRGHREGLLHAAFSPDGTHVVTASKDGTARIWRVEWTVLMEHLRRSTRACLTAEQRIQFLAQSPSVARDAHEKCERAGG